MSQNQREKKQSKTNKERFSDMEKQHMLLSKEIESMRRQIATGIKAPVAKIETQATKFDIMADKINRLFMMSEEELETSAYDLPAESDECTVYTDAWADLPFHTFCIGVYENMLMSNPKQDLHILDFLALCDAALQLSLMSNRDIIGVAGWTREESENARILLQELHVPDVVMTAIATFRPVTIFELGVRVVLLPYRYKNSDNSDFSAGANRSWTHVAVQAEPPAPPSFSQTLKAPVWWKSTPNTAPAAFADANIPDGAWFTRKGMFLRILKIFAANHLGQVRGPDLNNLMDEDLGTPIAEGRSIIARMCGQNVLCASTYYDVLLHADRVLTSSSSVMTVCVEMAKQSWFASRTKREIPYMVASDHVVAYTGRTLNEKFVPLFQFDSTSHVGSANVRIGQELHLQIQIWRLRKKSDYLTQRTFRYYGHCMRSVGMGDPRMMKSFPADPP